MQLDYEPPRRIRRPSLQLLVAEFGAGMLVGNLIACLVSWQFAIIACFPFYAVIPLIGFSISLLIRSWLLRTSHRETHPLLTISAGAVCIGSEYLAAFLIENLPDPAGPLLVFGSVICLSLVSGWVSLRRE